MTYQTEKKIDLGIINRVLPEYEAISKAGDDPVNKLYKVIDTKTGDISLAVHPNFWDFWVDERGMSWKRRPALELKLTYDEACRDASSSTASSFKRARSSGKNIFDI